MKDFKRNILTLFIFSLSIFFIAQTASAQETWKERREERRERLKERIRERAIEKKREETDKPGTEAGLGGIDARIPLKWITGSGQEGDEFVYGAGDYGRKLRFDGIERFYEIHVPPDYDITQPAPVVLNFHGGGGYPAGARYQSGMDSVADKNGFIVVYPAGTGKLFNDRLLTWNDGRLDKDGKPYTADDVGFVAALLDDLAVFFNVDTMRIYATGISNGAQFSYTLANKLSDRIAAIAPIAGHRTVDQYFPPPSRPISVMQFSGLEDKLAPYYGGALPERAGPVVTGHLPTMKSVETVIQSWITHNGCATEPIETKRIGKAVMTRYGQGKDNTEVILWALEDGGHTWPGGKMFPSEIKAGLGYLNTNISASELMWEFFKGHTLNNRTASSPEDVDISQTSCENDTCSKDEVKLSYSSSCGNGVCEDSETDTTCSKDCCAKIYKFQKQVREGGHREGGQVYFIDKQAAFKMI